MALKEPILMQHRTRPQIGLERGMKRVSFGTAGLACMAVGSNVMAAERPVAWSNEPPPRVIEDRLAFEIGVLPASIATEVRVDESADAPGTTFSAEDDFGLDDFRILPVPEVTFRPSERHFLRLSSLIIRRQATVFLERTIVYDEDTFEVGDVVDSTLDLNLIGLGYGYDILKSLDYRLAATFTVQIADVKTNARVRGEGLRQPSGELAPVPALGLEGSYFFSQRWAVEGRFQYFSLSTDEIEGTFSDARLAIIWQKNPHLAIGLGYRSVEVDAESFDGDSAGLVKMTIEAPLIFARASF
jgi:hypothetical protein